MTLEALLVLLMPLAALVYLIGPMFPIGALVRRTEWLLAACIAVVCYVLPPVLLFSTFWWLLDFSSGTTLMVSLALFGPAAVAVTTAILILVAYGFLWRFGLLPRGRLV
ncbi:MAG: hypothetical protein M0D54_03265 [Hyphomonadaceae bacterium JAD_PAG50586_4]|nr:MAG: hypothetical protein M0D54_03265 [Hyphomonadaceae bacterium JAD_PAG50586_4]